MECPNCSQSVEEGFKFCQNCGAKMEKPPDINVDQEIGAVEGNVTGTILDKGVTAQGISANTKQKVDKVESGGTVVGTVVGGEGGTNTIGGVHHHGDDVKGNKRVVHTEGGIYVQGGVKTEGGDFVAGDKVSGDKVAGDKVSGDKIATGNISGAGIAIGRGASASVTQGAIPRMSPANLSALFAPILAAIQSAPVDKQQAAQQKAQALQAEVAKANQAEDETMAELIEGLSDLVPGTASALVTAFRSPQLAEITGPVTQYRLKRIGRN